MTDEHESDDTEKQPDELVAAMRDLQNELADATEIADQNGAQLLARNFELWQHTLHLFRADLDPEVEDKLPLHQFLGLGSSVTLEESKTPRHSAHPDSGKPHPSEDLGDGAE